MEETTAINRFMKSQDIRHYVWTNGTTRRLNIAGFAFWLIPVTFPHLLSFFRQQFYQSSARLWRLDVIAVAHRADNTHKAKAGNKSMFRFIDWKRIRTEFIRIKKNARMLQARIQFRCFVGFGERLVCAAQVDREDTTRKYFQLIRPCWLAFSLSKRFFQFHLWSGTNSDTKPCEHERQTKRAHTKKEEWSKRKRMK